MAGRFLMHDFQYKNGELYCEEVPLEEIASEMGTPLYVYSYHTLVDHFQKLDDAFAGIPHLVCYSVKANPNLALLKILSDRGAGADVISGGELFRAIKAGVSPNRIVFAGIGKTQEEIEQALDLGVLMLNVESSEELKMIDQIAGAMGKKARIALRVNPDIDARTHPYVATALKEAKFGIDMDEALEGYRMARGMDNLEVTGVHLHLGSQITDVDPYLEAVEKVEDLVVALQEEGFQIRYVNMGGGFGIPYQYEEVPLPADYAAVVGPVLEKLGCVTIWEIGRMIVGNAGVLLTRVLYRKSTQRKEFIIVDAAMNDLIRPSLYGSYHEIKAVRESERPTVKADVVGPVCESGDFLALDRDLPIFDQGELAAVMGAGAYAFSMSSNYNSRRRAAEVLVKGDRWYVIRRREAFEDLIRGEEIPEGL